MVKNADDRFFGRRKGRPLNKSREQALGILDEIGINEGSLSLSAPISPDRLFNRDFNKIYLEIGFGNGEHLFRYACNKPDTAFIGAEPFINGVSALCKQIQDSPADHDNIRIWPDDVRLLLKALNLQCLDKIIVLNPDPWPKKKHHRRRIINPDMLDLLYEKLKDKGKIFMTTDVDDLAQWMALQIVNHAGFKWDINSLTEVSKPPENWEATRYEQKGFEKGHRQYYLTALKRKLSC